MAHIQIQPPSNYEFQNCPKESQLECKTTNQRVLRKYCTFSMIIKPTTMPQSEVYCIIPPLPHPYTVFIILLFCNIRITHSIVITQLFHVPCSLFPHHIRASKNSLYQSVESGRRMMKPKSML